MVPNSSGTPPAVRTPSLARSASLRNVMLQGVTSFQAFAIPICGLDQSASVRPTARSMDLAGAFCIPVVTSCDLGFMFTGVPSG